LYTNFVSIFLGLNDQFIGFNKEFLIKRSKLKINTNSDVFRAIRDMYAKKMRLYPDKIKKAFSEIFPAPQIAAQLQKNIK
jgi:hypothetical protein